MIKCIPLTFFVLYSCSVDKKESYIYENANQSDINNFFNIQNTGYRYCSYPILTIDLPHSNIYQSFIPSHYMVGKENKIDIFPIYKVCEPDYEKEGYAIFNSLEEESSSGELSACGIYLYPFIDFGIKELDTLKYFSNLAPDYWIFLKRKYYNSALNDTLFYFIRKSRNEPLTLIVAGKHSFINGIANVNLVGDKMILSDTLGKIYYRDHKDLFTYDTTARHFKTIELEKPDVDLSKIRALKKYNRHLLR